MLFPVLSEHIINETAKHNIKLLLFKDKFLLFYLIRCIVLKKILRGNCAVDRHVEKYLVGLMVNRSGDVQHQLRWEDERRLLDIIRQGRPDLIGSVLAEQRAAYEQTIDDIKYSESESNQSIYQLVSAVTMFCRAAIMGGVPETLAYSMMESYIYCAERYPGDYFLDALYSFTEAVAERRAEKGSSSPQIRKMKSFILDNLNNPLTLEDIAGHMCLSPSRCSHLFREKTGMTIHQYIEYERINASFAYLAYTDRPISWISEYLMYSSPSHFASVFRKYAGMTPTEWQEKNRRF